MKRVCVDVSPGTFRLIETDETYRQQVSKEVLIQQENKYDEVIFIPLDDEGPIKFLKHLSNSQNGQVNQFASNRNENPLPRKQELLATGSCISPHSGDEKQYWCDAATKLMLSINEDLRPKLGKTLLLKNKNKMYKVASEEMAKNGYSFTPTQIENKFRGLGRQFKKVALNNKQTGRSRLTCSFENELSKILGEKRSIVPEFVLDSGNVEGVARANVVHETTSEVGNLLKDDEPCCSSSAAKRRKVAGIKEKLIEKLDEIQEEKKEFHSAVLNYLKKKDEREERRDKRAQKNGAAGAFD